MFKRKQMKFNSIKRISKTCMTHGIRGLIRFKRQCCIKLTTSECAGDTSWRCSKQWELRSTNCIPRMAPCAGPARISYTVKDTLLAELRHSGAVRLAKSTSAWHRGEHSLEQVPNHAPAYQEGQAQEHQELGVLDEVQ